MQLQNDCNLLMEWFSNNGLKANPDKFHLILNDIRNYIFLEIQQLKIFNSNHEKLHGIKIDNKLSFEEHVSELMFQGISKITCTS